MSGIVIAGLWMTGALLSFLSMAIAGRELSAELNTFQILFFRSLIGLMIVAAVLSRAGWHQIHTRVWRMHIVRNVAHYVGQFGWFFAISVIPLAQVFAIEFTIPIWTAVIAPFLLGERLTTMRGLVIAIGFAGILIILRPGMVPFEIGAAWALIAAIGYALSHTLTKKITRTDTPLAVIFYMTVIQLPMGAVPSLLDWTTPSMAMVPWLIIVGATALSAHYCMARAFAHADAMVVVPMDFLRLPLVAMLGLVFYGEPLDPWVLAGAAIIFGAIFLNIMSERKKT
ncbi:MAG: DMT family transporter [Rhodospirillales bacterium]|nr:DMT family transporter [Rhodospirillales bacterium]MBO6785812.1 DMT family transporter [Rhodospirillales bacterium]